MNKIILAIWNAGQTGKTETIRRFANELITTYPWYRGVYPSPFNIPTTGDFRAVVKLKKNTVGIESQGDPNTRLGDRLEELIKIHECNIIVCSCRTRGETPNAISGIASRYGYEVIWTSTYHVPDSLSRIIANEQKGKHLLQLLQSLSIL